MRKLFSLLIAGAALASISTNLPAQADDEMWFNPFTQPDPYYAPPQEEAPAPPPVRRATPAPLPKASLIDSAVPMTNRITEMPQMRILGLWVGNMKYRVGQADGRLYLVDAEGGLKLLPAKTDADAITVPADSPVLSQLESNQPKQNLRPDPNGPKFVIGQTGLLKPKVIGTRTAMIDGKPVVTSGVIISEYAPSSSSPANQWNPVNSGSATSASPVSAQAQAEALYRYRALEQPNFLPRTTHIHTAARVFSDAEIAPSPTKMVQGKTKHKRASRQT